jgi:hypothetical protein
VPPYLTQRLEPGVDWIYKLGGTRSLEVKGEFSEGTRWGFWDKDGQVALRLSIPVEMGKTHVPCNWSPRSSSPGDRGGICASLWLCLTL